MLDGSAKFESWSGEWAHSCAILDGAAHHKLADTLSQHPQRILSEDSVHRTAGSTSTTARTASHSHCGTAEAGWDIGKCMISGCRSHREGIAVNYYYVVSVEAQSSVGERDRIPKRPYSCRLACMMTTLLRIGTEVNCTTPLQVNNQKSNQQRKSPTASGKVIG